MPAYRPPAFATVFVLLASAVRAAGPVDAPPVNDGAEAAAGRQPIERVAEFFVEEEALGVRTSVRPTDGLTPVEVSNLPGTVRVDVTVRSRRDRPGGLMFFRLMHNSPEIGAERGVVGGATTTDTNVLARPGYLQVNRIVRSDDELWTTSLTQSGDFGKAAAPLADRDDRVSLRVRRVRLANSELAEDVTRTAPTFAELVRRYPHEAAEHLGPIFRDFKQEATVFGADARVAWQVLSGRLPRDPSLVPKVEALVRQLDAGDYREREDASRRLRELGGPGALVLSDLPREKFSAEQNSRIDTILAAYRPLPPEEAAERLSDPDFLLNCLAYSDDPLIRAAAAGRLGELIGKPVVDPPADRERRLDLVKKLRTSIERREPRP